jgi:hypothetical protein
LMARRMVDLAQPVACEAVPRVNAGMGCVPFQEGGARHGPLERLTIRC